jgi:predicted O-methyltransferase YrrM
MRIANATDSSYSNSTQITAPLYGNSPINTLTTEPVKSLIARLFAEAESSDATLTQQGSTTSPEERHAMMRSTTHYREFYGPVKEFYLAVSPNTARLLYMLARSTQARSIVEFGTSFGISTIHLAAAVRDNGGGRVIGSEFESAKGLYSKVLSLLEGRLRAGALIVADNADYCPEYLARVRSLESRYLSVPFAGDIEVSMRN